MNPGPKVDHRLIARFAMRRLHALLTADDRVVGPDPLGDQLKLSATVDIGSYRHLLHAFPQLPLGKLVMGCLLPVTIQEPFHARSLKQRLTHLPVRTFPDGSRLRTSVGQRSLDTWVHTSFELWTGDSDEGLMAIDELLLAASEAFAALQSIRPARRSTPPPRAVTGQLPLFEGEENPSRPPELPLLTP